MQEQIALYREAIRLSEGKPIVFRLLDVGGDKVIPYLRAAAEENPAMGFRSLRLALDRPGLLRTQVRALLTAADGGPMKILVPMVTETWEFVETKRVIRLELERLIRSGGQAAVRAQDRRDDRGALAAVRARPCAARVRFRLDRLQRPHHVPQRRRPRQQPRVSKTYDPIALPRLRALRHIVDMAGRYGVPITMCGELAGRTVEALALMAIGMTRLSMSPPAIGPIKEMVMGMELDPIRAAVAAALGEGQHGVGIRELLMDLALTSRASLSSRHGQPARRQARATGEALRQRRGGARRRPVGRRLCAAEQGIRRARAGRSTDHRLAQGRR